MRDDAYFVNVTRRPIVATGALVDALDAGELASTGPDVFPEELPRGRPARGALDVLTTPYVAWHSEEANDQGRRTVVGVVRTVLEGGGPYNVVNE